MKEPTTDLFDTPRDAGSIVGMDSLSCVERSSVGKSFLFVTEMRQIRTDTARHSHVLTDVFAVILFHTTAWNEIRKLSQEIDIAQPATKRSKEVSRST